MDNQTISLAHVKQAVLDNIAAAENAGNMDGLVSEASAAFFESNVAPAESMAECLAHYTDWQTTIGFGIYSESLIGVIGTANDLAGN